MYIVDKAETREASTPLVELGFDETDFQALIPTIAQSDLLQLQGLPSLDDLTPSTSRSLENELLKEELKCALQLRLLKAGKDIPSAPLTESSDTCSNDSQMSEQEQERRQRRRDRNREAAQRCRQRKRERADELAQEIEELVERNKRLKRDVAKLDAEKESLMKMMRRHDKATQCDATLLQ